MFHWRVFILFVFIVLLPAIIVGISNWHVFPDSFVSATLMLIVTVGVAGVFSYFAGDATPKISRYCIVATIVVAVILCANLAGHWLLAREVSGARQGVEERHVEEDRAKEFAEAEAQRQIAIAKAETDRAKAEANAAYAERRRLEQLPIEQRRARPVSRAAKRQQSAPSPALEVKAAVAAPALPRLTPDQVREKWWLWLTILAIAEVAASVLGGSILAGIWEWDRNHDGIADHKQGRGAPLFAAPSVEGFARASKDRDPKAPSDRD